MSRFDNLIRLLEKYEHGFGCLYGKDSTGELYYFVGITVECEDYSYVMQRVKDGFTEYYSCVGKLEDIFTELMKE